MTRCDSKAACFAIITFMLLVFLFGIAGIVEAGKKIEYHGYIWVPILLVLMSGGIIVSTTIRLIRRYSSRY